eukprot:gene26335-biopygen15907
MLRNLSATVLLVELMCEDHLTQSYMKRDWQSS